ncbi:unnamed protein product [Rodentolepis nana]|uniref:Lectin_legB domain-containing protein n=1 Tax=Rodentolepis nana TaxID=102285 RepID=A0A0R3TG30_RODNA|nr:unnamed protein product [Rodentolepis nana]
MVEFSITVPETASVGVDFFEIYIHDTDVMDFGKHSCILSSANAYFGVVYNPNIDACGIRNVALSKHSIQEDFKGEVILLEIKGGHLSSISILFSLI